MKDTHTDSADQIGEFRSNKKKRSGSVIKLDTAIDSPSVKDAYTNLTASRRRAKVDYTAVRKQLALLKKLA